MYWVYNNVCVFFFLSVGNILGSKHASIFEISIFSDRKVNLVGTFRKRRKKLPRNYEKPLKMGF